MALGLVCFLLDPDTQENLTPSRNLSKTRWEKNFYSTEEIYSLYLANIENKITAVEYCHASDVRMYRLSSGILPLWEKIQHNDRYDKQVKAALRRLGKLIRKYNMRINFHPDLFCLVGTDREEVYQRSLLELQNHVYLLESMELEESVFYNINIHAGGKEKSEQCVRNILRLPDNVRNRITLENDEYCYSVEQLYQIYQATGVPIVFDSHHHSFNPGNLTGKKALELALKTWKDIKPTTHISNSKPGLRRTDGVNKRRAHSDWIRNIPPYQLKMLQQDLIDVEVEAKKKSLAYFELRERLNVV